jgi:hypothetical protein
VKVLVPDPLEVTIEKLTSKPSVLGVLEPVKLKVPSPPIAIFFTMIAPPRPDGGSTSRSSSPQVSDAGLLFPSPLQDAIHQYLPAAKGVKAPDV